MKKERAAAASQRPSLMKGIIMTEYIFYRADFGEENEYSKKKGFGFFINQWGTPELNSGFVPSAWFQDNILVKQDAHGCFVTPKEAEGGRIPLSFKADLKEEGRYLLTVSLYSEKDTEEVLVFAGRRQLIFKGKIKAKEERKCTFPVCVCDFIPRGETLRQNNRSFVLTVTGRDVRLVSIKEEPWEGKTVFIAGDSTVTDQSAQYPYFPEASYGGWGQMLLPFLNGKTAVSNHSHSGLTTESFRKEGHYEILKQAIRAGDLCLFQFGHNDQKLKNLTAEGGYRHNLVRYIKEIREKEAVPVLVTPLARNSWKGNDGSYNDLLEKYAKEVMKIGEDLNVPVLDLHERSMEFIKEHGLEDSKRWFYPSDYTHTNDYGAWKMAGFVWEELKKTDLFAELPADFEEWEPPEAFKEYGKRSFRLRAAEQQTEKRPEPDRPKEILTRAEALDFIIRTVNYFPVNVYNDFFSDILGHEWYAGTVECALQNGLIPEEMTEDGCFFPERAVTLEEFLCIAVTGYKSRKKLPPIQTFAKGSSAWAQEMVSFACTLGAADPNEDWKRPLTRKEGAAILNKFTV